MGIPKFQRFKTGQTITTIWLVKTCVVYDWVCIAGEERRL
jgi:hypothetical protein